MFAVPVTREMRAVGVLLGGSGRTRMLTLRVPQIAALMKPFVPAIVQTCGAAENRAAGGRVMLTSLYRKRLAAPANQLARRPAVGQGSDRPPEKGRRN